MNYQYLIIEKKEDIACITINREEVLNALTGEVILELDYVFHELHHDEDVRCIILTGKGRAFVAGADISLLNTFRGQEGRKLARLGQAMMNYIEGMDKPVIAAINGFAIGGGCELAMCCDIRIASEKAKLGQPEVNLGITPGYGGSQRMTRLVGKGMAKYLCLTGEQISAQEAKEIGLVEKVVSPEELMDEAFRVAKKIASKAPIAAGLVKLAINMSEDVPLAAGIAYEAEIYNTAFKTEDRSEGLSAFLEKRNPIFSNK
ncbi:enoyl-CoA hydratase/isomerase family protein [Sinanaerobacter chloroacetimidivorans]|uniref:short-chain-enoyl-CoA hydratase n=1 Tax=Sinanaerobacter chloroacetimidivorans TaxID=2818044 RepID=A0A8J7W007_9FIRM|nr:enoyl-CoA hydratase-related protein [Sinanaerobacter chloroacetimidivorans]MBR0597846.1 enoyl-CoA hydratase/isomerase family protein [Sinanaerobacter chloroacetimidivorans]